MAKIISIFNQKGGVGKTTTAVNLSAAIGKKGKRVLLVDIDPQGNSTSGLGVDKSKIGVSTYDVLVDGVSVEKILIETPFKNVHLLPSNMNVAGADLELADAENREKRLKNALDEIKDNYDFIFIDCPPSLGMLSINSLTASDSVLVPIQCEYYALEGLSQLVSTIKSVKMHYNESLEIEGIVFTMFDARLKLNQQVVDEVEKFFPNKAFKNMIPRNVRLSEAPSFGMPVCYYDKLSKGTWAYKRLAGEFLENNK